MKCGQEVQIIDPWGSMAAVAVSQCGDSFLVIVHDRGWRDQADAPFRNGEQLFGWPALLDRLMWLIGHPPNDMGAYAYVARRAADVYIQVLLHNSPGGPVLVSQLAKLLDAPADEVRAKLHDYLVVRESEGDHASNAGDQAPALG